MTIAFLLFDRFTFLDVIGPYEVLARIPDAKVVFAAKEKKIYRDSYGAGMPATHVLREITRCDVLVVPGGYGVDDILKDAAIQQWLRQMDATSTWTTSVCSGALLLAEAGLISNRKCTTHWKRTDQLRQYEVMVVSERYVEDGKYITSAGVSAGIDMAIFLTSKILGVDKAKEIQRAIEYDPAPPFGIL